MKIIKWAKQLFEQKLLTKSVIEAEPRKRNQGKGKSKQPHRPTGIAKAKRAAKKRRKSK